MIKKILFSLAAILTLFFISILGYLLYLDKIKDNDFAQHMGKSIEICNHQYSTSSEEYLNLRSWLNQNKKGWHNYYVSDPSTGTIVGLDGLKLIIGDDWVIARTDKHAYSINTQTKPINTVCNPNAL